MNKKVLITGANGFIGQHLVRNLLDNGYTIRAMKHINHRLFFIQENEVEWWEADLRKPEQLKGICKDIDIVYHLAAISRNDLSKTRDDFIAVNVNGTKKLLEKAISSSVKRFVYISTVEAAGFGDGFNPRKESDRPNPYNNYGRSKLEAEKVVINNSSNIEQVIIRLPMIYGPGTFLIVPKLFGMVKRGFYPLIGKGTSKMEFCYVENAVNAIILAGEKKEANGELFYVSDERSYSIREVITQIAKAMKKKVLFIYIPKRFAYLVAIIWEFLAKVFPVPPFTSPYSKKAFFSRETVWWTTRDVNIVSTEKIKNLLGYKPSVSIEEGCKKTATWLEDHWDLH